MPSSNCFCIRPKLFSQPLKYSEDKRIELLLMSCHAKIADTISYKKDDFIGNNQPMHLKKRGEIRNYLIKVIV